MHNGQYSFLSLMGLVLVTLDGDNIIVGLSLLRQVDLYSVVGADLGDHSASLADDQRMVFWVDLKLQFVGPTRN